MRIKKNRLFLLLRIIVALALTGALGMGILFAGLMVVCTGGGALLIVVPIVLVVLPVYGKIMKKLYVGSKKKDNQLRVETKVVGRNKQAIVQYIIDARNSGLQNSEISTNLLATGWSNDEIVEAFEIELTRDAK